MTKNSVAVIGRGRLAREIVEECGAVGLAAALLPDAEGLSPSTSLVVDTLAGPEAEKRENLKKLDADLPPSSIILTSCLGFAAARIASWTARAERVVGFATFYPIKQRKVLELTAGLRTQEEALRESEAFFRALGKETVRVKDMPGLVFPRILSLIINEAARSLEEGVAQAGDIDQAMRLGVNYPAGPLRWADQIGLDEVLAVLEGLQAETGDDRYRPTPLIKKMVLAGQLGESAGKGFYSY